MGRTAIDPNHALTLAEWRALNLQRPLTDDGIGAHTDGHRSANAAASAVFTQPDLFDITNRTGQGTQVDVCANERARRRKTASAPVCPTETSNDPTGTSTTPQTAEEHTR